MLLKIGSKNDYVKQVQTKLGLPVTGTYGVETYNAVKKWQAAHSLPADGIVNDATWNAMFGVSA